MEHTKNTAKNKLYNHKFDELMPIAQFALIKKDEERSSKELFNLSHEDRFLEIRNYDIAGHYNLLNKLKHEFQTPHINAKVEETEKYILTARLTPEEEDSYEQLGLSFPDMGGAYIKEINEMKDNIANRIAKDLAHHSKPTLFKSGVMEKAKGLLGNVLEKIRYKRDR